MPPLDLLMIFFWLGFIIVGSLSGVIRQILLLVALYSSAILAGTLHPYAASALGAVVGGAASRGLLEGFMMFAIFMAGTALLYLGLASVWKETRPVGHGAHLADTLIGGLLGVATGLLFVVVLYACVAFLTVERWPSGDSTRVVLLDQVQASVLQPVLADKLPVVYLALRPWFPEGLPGFPSY